MGTLSYWGSSSSCSMNRKCPWLWKQQSLLARKLRKHVDLQIISIYLYHSGSQLYVPGLGKFSQNLLYSHNKSIGIQICFETLEGSGWGRRMGILEGVGALCSKVGGPVMNEVSGGSWGNLQGAGGFPGGLGFCRVTVGDWRAL